MLISNKKNLPILPALVQTAVLALLSAAIPLTATLTSAVLAYVGEDKASKPIINPSAREIELSRSLHVFAFTSHDDLILNESEGEFTLKEWDGALSLASRQCCQLPRPEEDVDMTDDALATGDLRDFTRSAMESRIASDLYWK